MKPFVFKRATEVWPEGATLLHVYARVDLERHPQLGRLIHGCRQAISDLPVTFVDDQWLHLTIDQVTDTVAAEIPEQERSTLAAALEARLLDVEPFDVTVGSVLTYFSGIIADVHPDEPLTSLHRAVRSTIQAVRGPAATRYEFGVPHLTIAYAFCAELHRKGSDADTSRLRLTTVEPSRAYTLAA